MIELIKRAYNLWCKNCWVKRIDRELEEYNRLKRCLDSQLYVVNTLVDTYNSIYEDDLPKLY